VLDPRLVANPSRSMMRVMSWPSRWRLTSTTTPRPRWIHASGRSPRARRRRYTFAFRDRRVERLDVAAVHAPGRAQRAHQHRARRRGGLEPPG
jgi:hypothetical protein